MYSSYESPWGPLQRVHCVFPVKKMTCPTADSLPATPGTSAGGRTDGTSPIVYQEIQTCNYMIDKQRELSPEKKQERALSLQGHQVRRNYFINKTR